MALDRMTKLSWIYDLYKLGQGAASVNHAQKIYQQLLQHIVTGFESQSGSLALCNKEGNALTIVAGMELPEGVIGSHVAMGDGVLGWVASEAKPLLINGDLANDPRFKHRAQRAKPGGDRSSVCWPLRIEQRVIGALSVNRPAGSTPFSEADMEQGTVLLNLAGLALSNIQLQVDQQRRIEELGRMNQELEAAHTQLLQSEKMASIGQLAAGVAHEINNPIGYVYSNLGSLDKYLADLLAMLDAYEQCEPALAGDEPALVEVRALKSKLDIGFLREDLRALMQESKEGITRVKAIVQNLKDFSHPETSEEWQWASLHKGLDSTLNIVWNELKYKADVQKEYGDIPDIECLPSQLNQVFMNLLVNAGHAIEERGSITIRTGSEAGQVWVEVEDTGKGIAPENLKRIFEPFFTTKPVGKGTGLGLSLAYGIVKKHGGKLEVSSEVGKGTRFRVWLPVRHEDSA